LEEQHKDARRLRKDDQEKTRDTSAYYGGGNNVERDD